MMRVYGILIGMVGRVSLSHSESRAFYGLWTQRFWRGREECLWGDSWMVRMDLCLA
jgi:hypothetical protein